MEAAMPRPPDEDDPIRKACDELGIPMDRELTAAELRKVLEHGLVPSIRDTFRKAEAERLRQLSAERDDRAALVKKIKALATTAGRDRRVH
jgi:hypothetical protein